MLTTIKKRKINEKPTEKTRMNLEYMKLPRGVAQFSNASSNLFTLNNILLINKRFIFTEDDYIIYNRMPCMSTHIRCIN